MRIQMVIGQFYPIIGGAENQALNLSKSLIRKNISVSVVTLRKGNLKKFEYVKGIPVFRIFSPRIRCIGKYIYLLTFFLYLVKTRNKYDIIHIHQGLSPAFVAVLAGKVLRKKTIIKIGNCGERFDIKVLKSSYLIGRFMAAILKKANAIIYINSEMKKELIKERFPRERLYYIPNGVDVEIYEPPKNEKEKKAMKEKLNLPLDKIVLFVGTLYPKKNLEFLIREWKGIVGLFPHTHLILLGEGPQREELLNLTEKLGIKENVHLIGEKKNVEEYLVAADIFLLPSLVEGLSNALLEAMASGLPCAVSDIPGNRDLIIDSRNGQLFNPLDGEKFKEIMIFLLKNKEFAYSMGRAARETVKEYSFHKIVPRYLSVYSKLL